MTQASISSSGQIGAHPSSPAPDLPTPLRPQGLRIWTLTDGKAGDEVQCLGVAEALARIAPGSLIEARRVRPRAPFAWLAPRGPIDPKESPVRPGSPLAPPFPDIAIASGRRAIPYLAHLRRAAGRRLFSVILKDPRTGPDSADLIWTPAHDRLEGPNVLKTLTSPHRISPERLEAARGRAPAWLAGLPSPRAALLVGGDSRHHRFSPQDIDRFTAHLDMLARSGVSLMGTASRRTPEALRQAVARLVGRHGGWWWDGSGDNPYVDLLAHADTVIATADSVNMIGEAAATGRPILVFEPGGGHPKITAFVDALKAINAVHGFVGRLEGTPYPPLDSTVEIASAIARAVLARARPDAS
jgi:mitochondrial fission protein ELM1